MFELLTEAYAHGELEVVSFKGREQISRPFSFDVLVSAPAAEASSLESELLGASASLTIAGASGVARRITGIFARVVFEGAMPGRQRNLHRLRLVPRLWLLGRGQDSRVFQELSVPDIVTTVLDEAGVAHASSLARSYPPRAYCVQYRESDLEFVQRLLAEEGIFYFLEDPAGADAEAMVHLADTSHGYQPIADGGSGPATVRLRTENGGMRGWEDHVKSFSVQRQVAVGSTLRRGYDLRKPATELAGEARVAANRAGETRLRVYEHADHRDDEGAVEAASSEIRLEQRRARSRLGVGLGTCRAMAIGRWFSLEDHPSPDLNGRWALVRLEHDGRIPERAGEAGAQSSASPVYQNQFRVVPAEVPARPRLSRERAVSGMEAATVVGPEGEEIHTDEHGRIKVRFHWDRRGRGDDTSSCWIRALTPWAGAAYGMQFVPRVGMEVVVGFLGGRADLPVVIGAAHNSTHPPPFPLPTKKTQSGIRTRSTPGGGGDNELRFDDAVSHEQIYVHAQRDLDAVVEHDHTRTVHGKETVAVDGARRTTIGADHVRTVKGDEVVTIHRNFVLHIVGNQLIQVDGSGGGGGAPAPPPGGAQTAAAMGAAVAPWPLPPELVEARGQQAAGEARLLWLVQQLPADLYDRGARLEAMVGEVSAAVGSLEQDTHRLVCAAAALGQKAEELGAAVAPEVAAWADVLGPKLQALELFSQQARHTAEGYREQLQRGDGQDTPAPLVRVHQAASDALRRAGTRARQVSQDLYALRGAAAKVGRGESPVALSALLRSGGRGGGGGGGKNEMDEGQTIDPIVYNKPGADGTPETVTLTQGSRMDIVGPGEINASDGFLIKCGGSQIQLSPGGITIQGPIVKIVGTPILLN